MEGLYDGFKLGSLDGSLDGLADGLPDGFCDGLLLGLPVGLELGLLDGIVEGNELGFSNVPLFAEAYCETYAEPVEFPQVLNLERKPVMVCAWTPFELMLQRHRAPPVCRILRE